MKAKRRVVTSSGRPAGASRSPVPRGSRPSTDRIAPRSAAGPKPPPARADAVAVWRNAGAAVATAGDGIVITTPALTPTILDVLEHVAEDKAALTGIAGKLKPGGRILITVPAHPWMWSAHDVVNHHQRRYTRRTLKKVIAEAGLRLDMLRWFNSLLFPAAAGARAPSAETMTS